MLSSHTAAGALERASLGYSSPLAHPPPVPRDSPSLHRSFTAGTVGSPVPAVTRTVKLPSRSNWSHASCSSAPNATGLSVKTSVRDTWRSSRAHAHGASNVATFPAVVETKTPEEHAKGAWEALVAVRQASPLVQCITNYVAMDLSANTLLAAGASPAMVHGEEEVEEFVEIASVLCVNIGTLSEAWVRSMRLAARRAHERGKPWVLDPVAAGATTFRTQTCLELVALRPTVIRGNASEILALSGATLTASKGVDSTHQSEDALAAARELARSAGCVVAVSGAVDLVTDGEALLAVSNGVPLLQQITATGCSVTALLAAFVAIMPSRPLEAAAYALSIFGLAAEVASRAGGDRGPGSLRVHLLDALHNLTEEEVLSLAKVAHAE